MNGYQNSDRLYHNQGDGTFSDVTALLTQQSPTATLGLGFVASFVDYDNDDDLDIYLVNDQFTPSAGNTNGNHLWRNDGAGCGDWCWTDVSAATSTDYLLCGMGLAIGDYDKDNDLDFYFSNAGFCGQGGLHHLLQNQTSQGSPTFLEVTVPAGVDFDKVGWGTAFLDYDNDTWQDLYVASGNAENPLYQNNGDGTFSDVTSGANNAGPSRGMAMADYDNDGWVDLAVSNRDGGVDGHFLYRNQGQLNHPENHWLTVHLTGDGVNVNRDAVGVRVTLDLGDGVIHMQEVKNGSSLGAGNTLALHFGVGEVAALLTSSVATVSVDWPDGTSQVFENVALDQMLTIEYGQATTTYVDVAAEVGLVLNHELGETCTPPIGSGSAWADYDNDGDIDLFVTNRGGPNYLYRNEGNDALPLEGDTSSNGLPNFTDVAAALGIDDPTVASHGAVFVDVDNDGDQDLYVTAWEETKLYQNQLIESGSVAFVDVTTTAGIGDGGRPITAGWADFDQDGYLDLYIAKHKHCSPDEPPQSQDHLFHNNGDGTFTDVTSWLCDGGDPATCPQVNGLGFAPGWVDYDNDGDLDLYLVNDNIIQNFYHNVLWRNDGDDGSGGWIFTDVSATAGTSQSINAMGLGIGDYDNNGWLDMAFSNIRENYLLQNNQDGTFNDVSATAGIQRATLPATGNNSITWGTAFFDHDNDMWLDLLYVAGYINAANDPVQPNAFFANNGDGTFTDISASSGLDDPGRARNASIVDFDGDGLIDVFVGNYGEPPLLFHNQGNVSFSNTNHWLSITVEGTVSNRDGIGTRLWLTTPDETTQLREINSGPTHGGGDYRAAYFGLGQQMTGELKVRWPSGLVQDLGPVSADQSLHLVEPAIYVSSSTGGTVGTETFNDEDILGYEPNADSWTMVFDGSNVNMTEDINAFAFMANGHILMSLQGPFDVPGLGMVDDSDIIRFIPTALGAQTAGTFEMYFDGSEFDLTSDGENIDAIGFAPDGRLVISTLGNSDVTGRWGPLSLKDEDLLAFDDATNTWTGYFDGSDVELTASVEDVIGTSIDPITGNIYLTTKGSFSVSGASGDGADIFVCTPSSLGSNTTCTFNSYWDGSANGFDEILDGFAIGRP